MMEKLESILEHLVAIFSVFKRDERIVDERAERMDIRNRVRAKRAELRVKRYERKIARAERRLKRYKEKREK